MMKMNSTDSILKMPLTIFVLAGTLFLAGGFWLSPLPLITSLIGKMLAFLVLGLSLLLWVARGIKKRRRRPTLVLILANFLILQSLIGGVLIASINSFGRQKMASFHSYITARVENKLQTRKQFLHYKFKEMEAAFEKQYQSRQKLFQGSNQKLNRHFDESFKSLQPNLDKSLQETPAEREERWRQIRKTFFTSEQERMQSREQRRNRWYDQVGHPSRPLFTSEFMKQVILKNEIKSVRIGKETQT